MKELMLIATAALCLLSCHKSENDSAPSYWTIGNKTFIPKNTGWVDSSFYASDSVGLLFLKFHSKPTSDGIYYPFIIQANDAGDDYAGSATTPVHITFHSGKAMVEISNAWIVKVPMFQDSAKLSAHIIER